MRRPLTTSKASRGESWRRADWTGSQRCLEFYRTKRPIRTASITQVRQPVYKQSVARWKNYQDVLRDLFNGLPADPPREQG